MTNYVRAIAENNCYRGEAERLIAKFDTGATVVDGIVRWNSNNQVPPTDVLDLWKHVGKEFDYDRSIIAREKDMDAFFAAYRKAQANRSPEQIAEEQAMARAAHGPGVELVDVITGRKFRT